MRTKSTDGERLTLEMTGDEVYILFGLMAEGSEAAAGRRSSDPDLYRAARRTLHIAQAGLRGIWRVPERAEKEWHEYAPEGWETQLTELSLTTDELRDVVRSAKIALGNVMESEWQTRTGSEHEDAEDLYTQLRDALEHGSPT